MNPKILTIVIGTFLLFSNVALAIPSQPHYFYGSVTVNGAPADDGTVVSARINGVQVASTTTSGGKYGYSPLFFVPDTDPSTRPGSTITFFVSDVNTGVTEVFCTACFNSCGVDSDCSPLDLSVTIGTSSGTTSGSTGGGAGTTTTTTTTTSSSSTTQTEETCQEKWTCSDWSACEDGIQTRVCADENQCGTNSREPFSSQPCSTVSASETSTTSQSPIGFFLLSTDGLMILAIVGVVAIVAIFLFLRMRKTKSVVHIVKMDDIKQQIDQTE